MFTGIVTDIGVVHSVNDLGDRRIRIVTNYDTETIDMGASIASDGVCLTVVDKGTEAGSFWYDVDVSAETLRRSNLGAWTTGTRVNLERSLRLGDEMGGHLVTGHIDGTADIVVMEDEGASTKVTFDAPANLAKFIAAKGSVALNGTSLTVNDVDGTTFTVNMIPHTKQVTNWGDAKVGDKVNLEIDTLARYVARLTEFHPS